MSGASSCDLYSKGWFCAVDDVNDLWESLKESFEARVPFRKAKLNNKARNLVSVDRLHVEYVQTTDARIRRGFPGEQTPLPLWFRLPYACVVLVTCDVSLLFSVSFFLFLWLVFSDSSCISYTNCSAPL